MSTTLQRSSVSFRRQGSSGWIWDDPVRGIELKGTAMPEPSTSPSPDATPQFPDGDIDSVPDMVPRPPFATKPPPPKRRRFGFSSFFCACMRPPQAATPAAA